MGALDFVHEDRCFFDFAFTLMGGDRLHGVVVYERSGGGNGNAACDS